MQFDELYARVRTNEKARWLWLAIDPVSKALPALHLGGRTSADAYAVVHDFKERLRSECVPAATSDGLRSYFYALTAAYCVFSSPQTGGPTIGNLPYLLIGQLVKWPEPELSVPSTLTRWSGVT